MVNTTINIRTNSELKTQAQTLLNMLGIDMTTAINMFLRQIVLKKAIPFEISAQSSVGIESFYGIAKGKMRISDDFDEPLDELNEYM